MATGSGLLAWERASFRIFLAAVIGGLVLLLAACDSAASNTQATADSPTAIPSESSPAESPTSTPAPEPTAEPQAAAPEPPPPEPDRTSCTAITGTAYRSDTERAWFIANCNRPAPAPTARPATSSSSSSPPAVQSPPPSGGAPACSTPQVTITSSFPRTYFQVTGSTASALNAAIIAAGPNPSAGALGATEYALNMDMTYCRTGPTCGIATATIRVTGKVILPRHANENSLDSALLTSWVALVGRVTTHEERHVSITLEGVEETKRQLTAVVPYPTCDALDKVVDDIWASTGTRIRAAQDAFHLADKTNSVF